MALVFGVGMLLFGERFFGYRWYRERGKGPGSAYAVSQWIVPVAVVIGWLS